MFTRQIWLPFLRCLAYAAVAVVLVVAFRVARENRRLGEANKALRSAQDEILAASARPIVIRGFLMPLLDLTDTIEEHNIQALSLTRHLLLVYRASCDACKQQMPYWERLLDSPRLRDVETWLVSAGEDGGEAAGLVRVLRAHHLPYRLLRTRAAAAFIVATGIAGVPATVVTGNQGAVEFVEPGLADQARLDLILDGLERAVPAPSARVLPFGLIEPF